MFYNYAENSNIRKFNSSILCFEELKKKSELNSLIYGFLHFSKIQYQKIGNMENFYNSEYPKGHNLGNSYRHSEKSHSDSQ